MSLLQDDLVAIRKNRGLTPANVFERTRIPLSIIDEIERGTIFTNRNHQLTYIRSYVRSYAKALDITEEHIVEALDQQQADAYSGVLRKVYLNEPLSTSPTDSAAETSEITDTTPAAKTQSVGATQTSGQSTTTKGGNEYSRPDPKREYNQTTPPPPEVEAVDWAVVGRKASGSVGKSVVYVTLTLAVLIVLGLIYYLLLFEPAGDEMVVPPQEQGITAVEMEPADEAELDENIDTSPVVTPIPPPRTTTTPSAPVRPATTPAVTGVLPDTINIVLHATTGNLEPVRITSDINNVRSPYWVESRQAMRFQFIDSITIEGQLSRMALWINGHHFGDLMEFSSGGRTIDLSREALEQYAELFSREGSWNSQFIDSPTVINERPLF